MILPAFNKVSVLVAGDIMLDRYWKGATDRISPEAPVPVVKQTDIEDRLGGAANVALNLSTLGVNAELVGAIGNDTEGEALNLLLAQNDITSACITGSMPTISKLRVMSRNQQLLRIDKEEALDAETQAALNEQAKDRLTSHKVLLLSDYAKGALTESQQLIAAARAANIPVLIDPKGSDYSKYSGASLITPNRAELEVIVGSWQTDQELYNKAEALRAELNLDAIVVTLSEQGMLVVEAGQEPLHLPALAREVYDVTGAGDTVIATLAACIGAGLSVAQAAHIANQAAAIVVGKIGTAYVTTEELQASLNQVATHQQATITEADLHATVKLAKARGERIVMTNGCFDLLHPGHLAYLSEAASLGDRLIVAVNSDSSVKLLKGDSRPINTLNDRMQMLAAIKGVDWVVAFEEETPQRLISEVLPDVLVKGGDYKPEAIAGYKEVTADGGEVKILSFLGGYSSTAMIEKIKRS